jgi:hypothetical protein
MESVMTPLKFPAKAEAMAEMRRELRSRSEWKKY